METPNGLFKLTFTYVVPCAVWTEVSAVLLGARVQVQRYLRSFLCDNASPPTQFTVTLKSWKVDRGFGFIDAVQVKPNIVVRTNSVAQRGGRPQVDQRVTFEVDLKPQGKNTTKKMALPLDWHA